MFTAIPQADLLKPIIHPGSSGQAVTIDQPHRPVIGQAVNMRYSPSEVQQLLGIPDSTLRRLARDFLPPKQGSKRQYSERDISTLRLAREMLSRGLSTKQAKIELAKVVDLQGEEPPESESTALAPIDRRLSQLTTELEQLRQASAADRARIEALEKQIADLSRPWYKRLFPRPPK